MVKTNLALQKNFRTAQCFEQNFELHNVKSWIQRKHSSQVKGKEQIAPHWQKHISRFNRPMAYL